MPQGIYSLLSKYEIARLANLTIGSRFTVEGTLQGAHRSPLKGFSVEFADYRQYVPGDDLRHLDWRVYARNERLYIRQYEEECNLRVYILLDASASMNYGLKSLTKYEFARRLAASLAYVTTHQQDSVGLTVFDSQVRGQLPARSGPEHLRNLANLLIEEQPHSETDLARCINRLASQVRRRALIVLISDLFDNPEQLRAALGHFRHRKHDVIVYHVLDRAELEFPFRDIGNFQDLETGDTIITSPREIREAYQETFSDFLVSCQRTCASLDVDYVMATTDQEITPFIRHHLGKRQRLGR